MNNYAKSVLLLLFIFLMNMQKLKAQTDSARVEVIKDPRIDLLIKKQAQINKIAVYKNSRGEYKGFRLMIMNTNDRELAYKTRSDILRYYPEYNVYMAYQAPYFKIKMGDFIKRADAEKLKKEISGMFKQGTFVVQDIIKLSPEEEARLINEVEQE
jgi:hypothetical protein